MSDYKEVIDRLDQLIAITKLANKDKLDERKKQISNDEVSKAILELLESGPMDYSTLAEKTVEKSGKSLRTAQSRISELTDDKILVKRRESGKTIYFNSGILE